jgi:diguanylate cyclase (GGDEF)-like protein
MLRENDFVARLGDDRFLVLLPGTNLEQGLFVADKIRNAVAAAPHETAGLVEFNIGAAASSPDQKDERVAPDEADASLSAAKSARRQAAIITPAV